MTATVTVVASNIIFMLAMFGQWALQFYFETKDKAVMAKWATKTGVQGLHKRVRARHKKVKNIKWQSSAR